MSRSCFHHKPNLNAQERRNLRRAAKKRKRIPTFPKPVGPNPFTSIKLDHVSVHAAIAETEAKILREVDGYVT